MAGEKPDVLLVGAKKPVMMKGLEGKVTLHHWLDATDKEAFAKSVGDKIGAIAIAHHTKVDGDFLQAISQRQTGVELRRRLRPHRRQMGGRARHRRHQHAGRAERGGRRHRARPLALHGARIVAGRALSARRQVAASAVSSHQGDAAQPHRRHGRHGPHRQGDRAAAGSLRRAGRLSQPQSAEGRELQVLSEAPRHGARRRHADGDRAGRRRDGEHDQRRGAQGARARRASSSTWRAARWSTSRR